ncbi:hypothetical protein [Arthrobacter sp. H14]|uniref:hypothetical protein n=1 Tax=Arthrobacter sp. H14 TaxID=1312959 RepID=UPI0004AE0DC3|nr:hypothetical protein [Arthrobacter sp. H14]
MVKSASIAAAAAVSLCAIIGGAYLSLPVVVVVLSLASLIVGFGWPHLLGVPAKKTLGSIIAGSGIASTVTASLLEGGRLLLWFPAIVAVGVALVFLVQLLRGTGQSLRLESTIGGTAGVLICAMGGGWAAAEQLRSNAEDSGMMLVTGTSVVVALLVSLLPWPDRIIAPVGLMLATSAGLLGAILLSDVPNLAAAVVGLVCGAVVVSFRRLIVARRGPNTLAGALAVGVAPIAALGTMVYFLEKLLLV